VQTPPRHWSPLSLVSPVPPVAPSLVSCQLSGNTEWTNAMGLAMGTWLATPDSHRSVPWGTPHGACPGGNRGALALAGGADARGAAATWATSLCATLSCPE